MQSRTERTADEQALWERLKDHADLTKMHTIAQQFVAMVRQRHAEHLDAWLVATRTSGIAELQSFAEVLQRDERAVQAALTLT